MRRERSKKFGVQRFAAGKLTPVISRLKLATPASNPAPFGVALTAGHVLPVVALTFLVVHMALLSMRTVGLVRFPAVFLVPVFVLVLVRAGGLRDMIFLQRLAKKRRVITAVYLHIRLLEEMIHEQPAAVAHDAAEQASVLRSHTDSTSPSSCEEKKTVFPSFFNR